MKILVKRVFDDIGVTLSKVYINDKRVAIALEDPKRDIKIKHETAIPDGTYKLGLRYSPSFTPRKNYGHDLLWIKDVPNFEYILIHIGNTVDDTSGCLLLGENLGVVKGKIAILQSKKAYDSFYNKVAHRVKRGDDVEIQFITEE